MLPWNATKTRPSPAIMTPVAQSWTPGRYRSAPTARMSGVAHKAGAITIQFTPSWLSWSVAATVSTTMTVSPAVRVGAIQGT